MKSPKIFYFCYDHQGTTGGQKRTYRHVEILNRNGYQSFVFHQTTGFRLNWFDNTAPVVDASGFRELFDEERDYLVVPEDLGWEICSYPGRKVIFNKGFCRSLAALGEKTGNCYPYAHPEVIGAMVVSEHNARHLRFTFPHLAITKVDTEIDSSLFRFQPLQTKKRIIVTAKPNLQLATVFHMIQARARAGLNQASSFSWVLLGGQTQAQVADTLHDALFFLFFNADEGLGRMLIEAAMSGCLVAGYQLGAATECPQITFKAAPADYIPVVEFIEGVMAKFPSEVGHWAAATEAAYETAKRHSADNEERSVILSWERLFQAGAKVRSATA